MIQYVSGECTSKLMEYLLNHEEDICMGINDMDDLKSIFYELIGRLPQLDSPIITEDELRFIQKRIQDKEQE